MNSKVYIFLYIYLFIGVQPLVFADSKKFHEDITGFIEPKERIDFFSYGKNVDANSNSNGLGEIEESDFFESEDNPQGNKNLNAKNWTINIKLGPFKSKNYAEKALKDIKINSSEKLFGTITQSPILSLPKKFFSFEIVEVSPSVDPNKNLSKPDKKLSQINLKNRSLKDYKKPLTLVDAKFMTEVITAGMPLRVRESPLITSPIVYRVQNGSKFLSVEEPVLDKTGDWVRIEYLKGEFGWVSKIYSKIKDLSELKQVDGKNIEAKPQFAIGGFNLALFNNWIKAWESKDVELYFSFYAENFKGYKENRSVWEESRRHALKSHLSMTIEARNLNVIGNEKKVKVSFVQVFKSENYTDVGNKNLEWEKVENDWKIVKETWKPL